MSDPTASRPAQPDTAPGAGTSARTSGTQVRAGAADKLLGPALLRYRVMAYITGAFLLLLCVEMFAKYVLLSNEAWLGSWIAIVHGWIYVVYLVTVLDLWSKLRWSFGRLVALVLAGVVPVLSFVAEHRTTAEVKQFMAERGEA